MTKDEERLLQIYLEDHLAASLAGVDLARRFARGEQAGESGEVAHRLADEIEADATHLRRVAEALGADTGMGLKQALAWLGEKLGRLKLNGRLTERSPLSALLELEMLQAGVTAKLGLWRALRQLPASASRAVPADVDLEDLVLRAERQRETLERLHAEASRLAFSRDEAAGHSRSEQHRNPIS